MKIVTLLSTLLYLSIHSVSAQPGALDPGFGSGGIVKTDIGKSYPIDNSAFKVLVANSGAIYVIVKATGGAYVTKRNVNGALDSNYGKNGHSVSLAMDMVYDALIQADGKILIAGSLANKFSIARLNTTGSADDSFLGEGIRANAIAVQTNGQIVVANNEGLARYYAGGSIDTSFHKNGKNGIDVPTAVAIQQDGKIVIEGKIFKGGFTDLGLCRFNANGSIDTGFGEEGRHVTALNGYNNFYSLVIQNDGKIIAGGVITITAGFGSVDSTFLHVARFKPDGNPDSTFGTGSERRIFLGRGLIFHRSSMALQNNQKIVLGSNNKVFRLNSNGSTDTTFSKDGQQTTDFDIASTLTESIAVQKDGKIVAAGDIVLPGIHALDNVGLNRFTTDGSIDSTFGNNGVTHGNLKQGYTVYKSVAIQKDGKVVAAGYTWNGDKFIFAVSRYTTTGTPDSSFSGDGIKTTSFGLGNDMGTSVAIQADGKIVVGGATGQEGHRDFAFARYTTAGETDNTFSGDGKQTVKFGTAGDDHINAIAIQKDGKIIAVGESKLDAALARLTVDGNLDVTFGGGDGKQTINIAPYPNLARAVALQKDGRIVVGGVFYPFKLARFTSNGYLDKTFGNNGMVTGNFLYDLNVVNAVAIQSDGKIIAGADISYLEEANTMGVARYTATGAIDNSFGDHGRMIFPAIDAFINSLAIEGDGKILAGGVQHFRSTVTRITISGAVDSTFGTNGTRVVALSGGEESINSLAVQNNSLYAAATGQCPGYVGIVIKYMLNGNSSKPMVDVVNENQLTYGLVNAARNHEVKTSYALQLSPNPVQNILTVKVNGPTRSAVSGISIISSSGITIKSVRVPGSAESIPLNVSSLKQGVYTIKLITGNGVVYKQFVKM